MQIDLKNAQLYVQDGSGKQIAVSIGEGNLEYTTHTDVEYIKRRGLLSTTREGDEQPIEVAFQFVWEQIASNSYDNNIPDIEEALTGTGVASDWVSTNSDTEALFSVNLTLVYTPTTDCAAEQTRTFPMFAAEDLAHSLRDGTVDVKGKCNVTRPTSALVT